MEEKNIKLKERDIMLDALMSQDYIAGEYNSALLEATTPHINKALSAILSDEQEAQNEITELLISRGWQEIKEADKSCIAKIKEKFSQK